MKRIGLLLVLLVFVVAVPVAWAATSLWNGQFSSGTSCGPWYTNGAAVELPVTCGAVTFKPNGRISRTLSPAKTCWTGVHKLTGTLYAEDWVSKPDGDNWYFKVGLKVDGYWKSCSVYRVPGQAYATFSCELNRGGRASHFWVIAKEKVPSHVWTEFRLDSMELTYHCVAYNPPDPTRPYFSGNHCRDIGGIWYCDVWMVVPPGYNQAYTGSLYSEYVVLFGSEYDQATRTWTLQTWFNQMACSHYATYMVHEASTGQLLDELKLYRTYCP